MPSDEAAQQVFALGVVEFDHLDSVLAEPVHAALEGFRFAHYDGANAKLPDKATAVPARRQRRDHDRVTIRTLATRLSKGVRLAVDRRIILLDAPVVSASEQFTVAGEQGCPNWNAALREAVAGFLNGDLQQLARVNVRIHASEKNVNDIEPRCNRTMSCTLIHVLGSNIMIDMVQAGLSPGDVLVFQLESGYAMMRLLEVEEEPGIWHIAVYGDFFPDVPTAEASLADISRISVNSPHLALTTRAFESTQVAAIGNVPLQAADLIPLTNWRQDPQRVVSDRSVRLLLGIR
jgi:hypothetical protein